MSTEQTTSNRDDDEEEATVPELPNWALSPNTLPFVTKLSRSLMIVRVSCSHPSYNMEYFELTRKVFYLITLVGELMQQDLRQCHMLHVLCLYQKVVYKDDAEGKAVQNWSSEHVYLVFLLSMMVSFKQQFDNPLTNAAWLRFTTSSLRQLNRMERHYLRALEYETLVQSDDLNKCIQWFLRMESKSEFVTVGKQHSSASHSLPISILL